MKPTKTVKSASKKTPAPKASAAKAVAPAPVKTLAATPADKTPEIKPAAAPTPVVPAPTKVSAPATVAKTPEAKPAASQRREFTTETIAAYAYSLWEQSGRPHGRDQEFWLQAEQKLKQEAQSLAA